MWAIYFVGIADDLKQAFVFLSFLFSFTGIALHVSHTFNKDLGLPSRNSGRLVLIAGCLALAFFLATALIPDSQTLAKLTNLQGPRP